MKKKPTLIWLIPLILLLLLIPFIVPSALPYACAEEALPEYDPVELANPNPGPVPTQTKEWGRKTREEVLYGPHADAFILGENGKPCAYLDGTISVRIEERTIKKTRVMFTWIQIADPTQLRSQFCQPYPSGKN